MDHLIAEHIRYLKSIETDRSAYVDIVRPALKGARLLMADSRSSRVPNWSGELSTKHWNECPYKVESAAQVVHIPQLGNLHHSEIERQHFSHNSCKTRSPAQVDLHVQ